jgi:hypothetical protein
LAGARRHRDRREAGEIDHHDLRGLIDFDQFFYFTLFGYLNNC